MSAGPRHDGLVLRPETARAALVGRVQATEVGEHNGMRDFAFSDPEGRWFAVTP